MNSFNRTMLKALRMFRGTECRHPAAASHSMKGPCWAAVFVFLMVVPIATAGARSNAPRDECSVAGDQVRLQLTVKGLRSEKGTVVVTVYGDQPEDFLAKGQKLEKVRLPARAGVTRGCVVLPKPGRYALAIYHDEDDNRHLTRGLFGLPTEGYAFSNDPEIFLRLPTFQEVAFNAQAAVNHVFMHIRYP